MGYIKAFSDKITVPDFLQCPPWEDVSWHNDVCPRFENYDLMLAVWVDYDTVEEREYEEWKKYTVVELVERLNDPPHVADEPLFATEDVETLELWLVLYETHKHLEGAVTALQNAIKPEVAVADELLSVLQMVKDRMDDLNN